ARGFPVLAQRALPVLTADDQAAFDNVGEHEDGLGFFGKHLGRRRAGVETRQRRSDLTVDFRSRTGVGGTPTTGNGQSKRRTNEDFDPSFHCAVLPRHVYSYESVAPRRRNSIRWLAPALLADGPSTSMATGALDRSWSLTHCLVNADQLLGSS